MSLTAKLVLVKFTLLQPKQRSVVQGEAPTGWNRSASSNGRRLVVGGQNHEKAYTNMKSRKIQDRIQTLREGLRLDRHQFAERIGLSYTAVWNWETKGTEDTFVPEDPSLRKIVAAFPIVTFDWLKYGTGDEPHFDELPADASKLPEVLRSRGWYPSPGEGAVGGELPCHGRSPRRGAGCLKEQQNDRDPPRRGRARIHLWGPRGKSPPSSTGDPRSLVNTNGDLGSCSRCSLRSARISSPTTGWVAGVPFLAFRTCRTAWVKSI